MRREPMDVWREINNLSSKLKPYRQGDLDGLCGLYAVVNALRLATAGERLTKYTWRLIFAALAVATDNQVGVANALTWGIDRNRLIKILKEANITIAEETGLQISVRRPLRRHSKIGLADLLGELQELLAQPRAALLIALSGAVEHWTVLHSVEPERLVLWDSGGMQWISLGRCRMGYEPTRTNREYVLRRGDVLLISAAPAPSESLTAKRATFL